MAANEFETSAESTAHSKEEQDRASWERYLEWRNLVLQFLNSSLSPYHLQHHRDRVELLKKCYFYLEIEPKHVNVRDQNQVMHYVDILQLIEPCRFQRIKKVGKTQTEIQLSLLTDLLEQLERGQEELSRYIETCDMTTFLSQWNFIMQRLSKLSEFMAKLFSLEVPGKLYVKHHLLSVFTDHGDTRLPEIRVSLCAKVPPIFDREESFARTGWAKLKWFTNNQESDLEQYELHIQLLTNGNPREVGYSRIQTVLSNTVVVQGLQPGRSYEFIVRRSATNMLVFQKWHDSITLTSEAHSLEDAGSSAFAPEG
ncbi:PREDICTED: uncharacterized protein C20orf195 homolog [Leptosomus discolor]|uniref:uncharacterized protein C20orf195 homolog n=1 Tax=Leptosomus discolor TaxID=188344 RepID=UPI0005226597|nr:PREDICTED: uncharacterized protein C20orf195 homolog [Leptosomus discolor]